MKFTKQQIRNYIDDGTAFFVDSEKWRHGTKDYWVLPIDNTFYRVCIPVHTYEGMLLEDEMEGIEVKRIQVTLDKWVKI